jgi:transcriptional regulator with XRE-family HTH domain
VNAMIKLRIKDLAKARGLNLSQVQRQTDLTATQLRRYWYNRTSSVNLNAIEKLARFFEVPIGDLFEAEDSEGKMSDKFTAQPDDIVWL